MDKYQPVGMRAKNDSTELSETKQKLLDSGIKLMRVNGYNATTVDDICAEAGVTKGGFFHYFKSKEDLAKAAVERFGYDKGQELHDAPYRHLTDPLDRVYGRLDFIKESVGGLSRSTRGCLIGSFAQELAFTHPEMRRVCNDLFHRLATDFEKDLTSAKEMYAPNARFEPAKLAWFFAAIFQGSSLLAKVAESNVVLMENIEQFRVYLQILFGNTQASKAAAPAEASARFEVAFD